MRRKSMGVVCREVGITLALPITLAIGFLVGLLFTERPQKKKKEDIMKDHGWWVCAVVSIGLIAVLRMFSQMSGGDITSNLIPLMGTSGVDIGQVPRMGYLLIEMAAALFVISALVFQLKKVNPEPCGIVGWVFGIIASMTPWVLGFSLASIFAGIGMVSFLFGICEYREFIEKVWVEFEKGIMTGCLLGASIRYGYTVGVLAVIVTWIVQDRGLWIGSMIGALVSKIGASVER